MDRETAEEIKRHISEGLHGVRSEIQDFRTELRSEIQEGLGGLRIEIQEVRTDLRTEIQGARTDSRSEIQESLGGLRTEIQEVRRHSDVIAESLRGEIRLVAEGVAGLDEKFTLEFQKVREEIGEVSAFLHVSYADLDRRKMDKPS